VKLGKTTDLSNLLLRAIYREMPECILWNNYLKANMQVVER
jgi:hypothetical protein